MAGEIQIGGTTFATESGGTVTVANVDSATNRQNLGLEIGVDVQAFDADTTKNDVSNTFTANQIISVTDNTNAALRVTQLGTGNALVVEDSTNPDSTPFVVDASGNVSIGASSPNDVLSIKSTGSGDFTGITINAAASGNTAGVLRIKSSSGTQHGEFAAYADRVVISANEAAGILRFRTNGADRMQIDSVGQINMYDVYNDTVTGRDLYIASTGKLGYVSSIRAAKTNISNLESVTWLYSLNPVLFQYRTKDEKDNYTDIPEEQIEYGLIAEEVETVNSDLVFYDETENGLELRGVQYSRLIAPLIKAVQQQQALIESQQSQIDALTARIEALEATP